MLCMVDSRTVFFGEYQCYGPGANYSDRASYGKQLQEFEAAPYTDISYIDGNEWIRQPDIAMVPPDEDDEEDWDITFIQDC